MFRPAALPKTILVGLPEAAVKESTHRVERAMANSGFIRPQDRVVINLAPAELPKDAGSFDLPIALGMLAGSGQLASELFEQYAVVGELALEGTTRPVKGALSMAMAAAKQRGPARASSFRPKVRPKRPSSKRSKRFRVASLAQAVGFFAGTLTIEPAPSRIGELFQELSKYDEDFADVRGQEMAKRAIVVAAAGNHNILMLGPPGSGKTMLAKRVPTILPVADGGRVDRDDAHLQLASAALPPGQPLMARRPYRSPHHTISEPGLVGGGNPPVPGEISLSHNGVLFLDELPEFNRRTLEVLRQPLEDGTVTIGAFCN